jgi:hypothetical protein
MESIFIKQGIVIRVLLEKWRNYGIIDEKMPDLGRNDLQRKAGEKKMKKYKFKAPNRTFQLLLPFLCAADNFAIVFLLCRLGLGILGRIGLADFLLQDPVLDYITKAVLILSVVYSLLPLVMPKGCFLYDDQVVLARYTITALNWKNKIAVPYYMIENAPVKLPTRHCPE